jgi:demethylmenaquinone methyltransferase/2-methoxy-6-polyprenyl-1,4-benzoquinol methylase
VNACTLGFDRWWKKAILASLPPDPAAVLDQASGTGILTFQIARRFPRCQVVGVELRREYLAVAQERARREGLANVEFVQGRAEDVLLRRRFDAITSSYLAKYADLDPLVAGAREMLREGGRLIVHDFTYPRVRAFASIWETYFRVLQSVGTRAHPEWREAFFGLPPLLRQTAWVEELQAALRRGGFRGIRVRNLTFGSAALVTAASDGASAPPRRTGG